MGILVTTYCNLNCRGCADLIPKKPSYHFPFSEIKENLNLVLDAVDGIDEILIGGGELWLSPEISQIIEYIGECEKVNKVIIVSNGTFLPNEKILAQLVKYNIKVRISGYPNHIAPKRQKCIETYKYKGITIEDLNEMVWLDMGGFSNRNRNESEMKQVFATCSMRNCVSLVRGGNIILCSRQLAALESDLYPKPEVGEYINISRSIDLRSDLINLHSISHISTCNYCDGISCATTRIIPTATQILPKAVFLQLLFMYLNWSKNSPNYEDIVSMSKLLKEYIFCFDGIQQIAYFADSLEKYAHEANEDKAIALKSNLLKLLNILTDDYQFEWYDDAENRLVGAASISKLINTKNSISIGFGMNSKADIVFQDSHELLNDWLGRVILDIMQYQRLYIESKLRKIQKGEVRCAICGLSYTQYGILEKEMCVESVNLSITSQDIAYSTMIAEKAIGLNPNIEYVVIPISYYQGFYDITSSDSELHMDVVSRIDIPILGNSRNFNQKNLRPLFIKREGLKLMDYITDQDKMDYILKENYIDDLENKEFFNEINSMNPTGGLKFNYLKLDEKDRYASGKITADLNCKYVCEAGKREVLKYLRIMLGNEKYKMKKFLFFSPPMTRYLSSNYDEALIEEFNRDVVSVINEYENAKYVNLTECEEFDPEDFCDFEHLNENGAHKLTSIISDLIMKW